jgi:hypothetical protein
VSERLAWAEEEMGRDPEQLKGWYAVGDEARSALMGAVHGEIDPRTLDEGFIREWQAEGRRLERELEKRYAALGKMVRESGMTEQEAAEALARGDLKLPE